MIVGWQPPWHVLLLSLSLINQRPDHCYLRSGSRRVTCRWRHRVLKSAPEQATHNGVDVAVDELFGVQAGEVGAGSVDSDGANGLAARMQGGGKERASRSSRRSVSTAQAGVALVA